MYDSAATYSGFFCERATIATWLVPIWGAEEGGGERLGRTRTHGRASCLVDNPAALHHADGAHQHEADALHHEADRAVEHHGDGKVFVDRLERRRGLVAAGGGGKG